MTNRSFLLNKRLIFVLVGIIITYSIFIIFSDIEQFFFQWNNLDWKFLGLLLISHFTALCIRSGRQKILLDSLGFPLSFRKNFVLFFSGLSMIMTPAGTGELIKSYFLKEHYGFELSKTAPLIFAEKYHNLLVGITILSIALIFQQILEVQILVIILMGVLAILYFSIKNKKLFSLMINKTPKVWIFKKLLKHSEEFEDQLQILSKKKIFLSSWILGLLSGFMEILGFYFGFLAFGLDVNFLLSTLIMYSSIILGSITFLPIGVGVTDLSIVGFLTDTGFSFSVASAFTIFIRITLIGSSILLGTIFLKFVIKK